MSALNKPGFSDNKGHKGVSTLFQCAEYRIKRVKGTDPFNIGVDPGRLLWHHPPVVTVVQTMQTLTVVPICTRLLVLLLRTR